MTMQHPTVRFRRAARAAALEVSEIVQISEAARALKDQGRDILSFGTGEPDFPTPAHVIEAAHQAALDGQTRYPPTQGTVALRKAIADDFQRCWHKKCPSTTCRVNNRRFFPVDTCFTSLFD